MTMVKRIGSIVLCVGLLLVFAGCGERYILDGPGMENDMPWVVFDLYRSDSYSQYNFAITVTYSDDGYMLTGECRDEDGDIYYVEDGIRLPTKEREYLASIRLQDLPDVLSGKGGDGDLIVTDAPRFGLVLTYLDGTQQEKVITSEMSLQIYEHFLPLFQKHGLME